MFRFFKHIHKSAHYDWYGNIDQEVKKFATDKKLEIEMLQVREEYRREFLEMYRMNWKPIIYGAGYISTLLDGNGWQVIRKKLKACW
jgi:two-component system phosphate regulon sensor histidine kinase PhoR